MLDCPGAFEEGIDGIADAGWVLGGCAGDRGTGAGPECPVLAWVGFRAFIGRGGSACGDPFAELVDLGRGVGLALVLGWHPVFGVGRGDPFEHGACLGLARDEGRSGLSAAAHEFDGVEAEVGLLLQGAVAGETAFLKQGADLRRVVDGGVGAMERDGHEDCPREPSDAPEQSGLVGARHAVLGGAGESGGAACGSRHVGRAKMASQRAVRENFYGARTSRKRRVVSGEASSSGAA